jgi:hypothetical protein
MVTSPQYRHVPTGSPKGIRVVRISPG